MRRLPPPGPGVMQHLLHWFVTNGINSAVAAGKREQQSPYLMCPSSYARKENETCG